MSIGRGEELVDLGVDPVLRDRACAVWHFPFRRGGSNLVPCRGPPLVDKAVKLAVIVGILLAGSGIFYHYVIYLPDQEQQKLERDRADREKAARQAEIERIEAAKRAALERRAALLAEQQRMEPYRRAEMTKHEAAMRNVNRKTYYDCLNAVRKTYEGDWANACKTQAEIHSTQLKNCLETRGLGEAFCHSTFGGADPSPQCALRGSIADTINKNHDEEKQRCLAEAKL
ncbi:MAG TPA: hypothetical protein VH867_03120 [Burkholderiales bacterium]